jgi:hypothetical protein
MFFLSLDSFKIFPPIESGPGRREESPQWTETIPETPAQPTAGTPLRILRGLAVSHEIMGAAFGTHLDIRRPVLYYRYEGTP